MDLFGEEAVEKFSNLNLENETDFKNFAKVVYSKVSNAKFKTFQVSFLSELLRCFEPNFKAEDFQSVQKTATAMSNTKLEAEKNKKKKKAKGELIRTRYG